MKEYLWPWQSQIMIKYPWELPLTFIILALVLSLLSWYKRKNNK